MLTPRRIILVLLALASLGLITAVIILLRTPRHLPPVDYVAAYSAHVTPSNAQGDNACELLAQASALWQPISARLDQVHASNVDFERFAIQRRDDATIFTDADSLAALQAMDDSGLSSLLDRIITAPHAIPGIPPSPMALQMSFANSSEARGIVWAESTRMSLASAEGDHAAALQSCRRSLALVRPAGAGLSLMNALNALSIRILTYHDIRAMLRERPIPPEVLRQYLKLLDEQSATDLSSIIEAEHIFALDLAQHWYHGHAANPPARAHGIAALFLASHASAAKYLNTHFEQWQSLVPLPPMDRLSAARKLDADVSDASRRLLLVTTMLPTTHSIFRFDTVIAINHDATRLMLALEIFHNAHNRYPASLDELTPDILPSIPDDPAAPGQALVYRPLDARQASEQRTPYLIYSRALDAIDDNANHADDSRIDAFEDPGYDYVVTTTRDYHTPPQPTP